MPFVQFKLEKISDQTRGAFDVYVYSPENGDTIADVTTSGYFDKARFSDSTDWSKSYIIANCNDGYVFVNPETGALNTEVFDGVESNILVTNNNTTTTTVTADPASFVIANIATDLAAPVAGYDSDFISGATGQAVIEHNDTVTHDYKVEFSGTIIANDPAFLNTYVGIRVISDLGQEFTGGVKFFPAGVSFGGSSPALGFSVTTFGAIAANEKLQLEVSSNTAGDLTLTDLIVFAVRIKPAS